MSTTNTDSTSATTTGTTANEDSSKPLASTSSSKNNKDVMKEILQAFYASDKYKDITFIVGKTEIPANEVIVKLRSSGLKEKLEDPSRDQTDKIVTLDDQNLEDFKKFLQFLYTNDCEITSQNVIGLFLLGKKYDVPSLCKKCLDFFDAHLTKDSAQTFVATSFKNPDLKEISDKCLAAFPNVMEKLSYYCVDKFNKPTSVFSPGLVKHILKQDRDDNAEEELFAKVFDWAKVYCRFNGLDQESSNIKEAMKDLIPYIRFGNLTGVTLATVVRPNDLIGVEELCSLFCNIALKPKRKSKAKVKTSTTKVKSETKPVVGSVTNGQQEAKTLTAAASDTTKNQPNGGSTNGQQEVADATTKVKQEEPDDADANGSNEKNTIIY